MAIDYSTLKMPMGDSDTVEGYYNKNPQAAMFRVQDSLPNFNKPNWQQSLFRMLPSLMSEYANISAFDPSLSFTAFLGLSDPMQRVQDMGPRGRGDRPMISAPRVRQVRRG